jgi:predicted P-loop ATPase
MINDRQISITAGASRRAKTWQRQTLLLSELYDRLRVPARGSESQAQYLNLPKGQQDDLKDVGGFVGGTLAGTRRKAGAVTGRDIITLDLDSIPADGTQNVLQRIEGLGCGYCVYSTRKHQPSAPRLRILLPLARTCSADEYEPCARRMAEMLGMGMADPSTFEAHRLMYWPSCSADAEYIYYTADKPLLSVDGLLATYANWQDTASWPASPGAVKPARLAARQGDPLAKGGVVGAFCRVYDIEAAMEKFIPGVYEPVWGMDGRYTFTGGSTTGGAVLYDQGRFLFSHHATDPCGGRLVNAFDLVRIHLFGARDDEAEPGTPTVRLPSFTAMAELARTDPAVASALLDERWEKAQKAFTALPEAEAAQPQDDGSWRSLLTVNGQGAPEKTMRNYRTVLEHDPRLAGKIRQNLFSGRVEVDGELPWARPSGAVSFTDEDAAQLRLYLEPFFGKVSKNDLFDIVSAVAADNAFHPVRDYLNALTWDGKPRLDRLLIDYLGAADTAYTRAVTRKALVAAVARVMTPGCKYDTMLVTVGAQGRHKSTILAKLGGAWFSDSLVSFGDKESMETIQGKWLNEIAEMQAMQRSDVNAVKMFLSKTSDYYRAAYGRYAQERPRQCVFFGTTNSRECLTDATGNRRFWPVDIDVIERRKNVFEHLDGERDQIWAEAVAYWRLGETLHLPPELDAEAMLAQEAHRVYNPKEGLIAGFLEEDIPEDWSKWDGRQREAWRSGGVKYEGKTVKRSRVCVLEIWCEALGKLRGDLKAGDSREINQILERIPGWEAAGSIYAGKPYNNQRCFKRITDGYHAKKACEK